MKISIVLEIHFYSSTIFNFKSHKKSSLYEFSFTTFHVTNFLLLSTKISFPILKKFICIFPFYHTYPNKIKIPLFMSKYFRTLLKSMNSREKKFQFSNKFSRIMLRMYVLIKTFLCEFLLK